MEAEYYGGDQSDDGGATPVQDERDSGSDVEDDVNDQHSGSDNESLGHHSENEQSDGEDDGQTRGHHMTDSENEDTPRQKDSDSENEDPPNHNASDSENEGAHGDKDSDSDIEDHPIHHISDSENEDALNHHASDSENEEPQKVPNSDSENEDPRKNLHSESENEEHQKGHASDSENEEPTKHVASDSENEEPLKHAASDSENEDLSKHAASDSENEEPPKQAASDSENEVPPKQVASDSENEEPPKHAASDSENEEPQKVHASDSENEEPQKHPGSDSEIEDVPRRKQKIESDDSDGGNGKEAMQNDSRHSDSEQAGEGFHVSDSEEEGPKRRKITDSDEDEERDEDKAVKRKAAVFSDSEDDEKTQAAKKGRVVSDVEESDSDASEKSDKRKKNAVASDSEEEEESKDSAGKKKEEKDLFGSDSESGNEQENLIADIFGESGDEEEEEFTGFNQEDLEEEKAEAEMKETADDSDSDDNIKRGKHMDFMSDFEMMLQRKKSISGKRRRNRDGGTFISDADDVVSAMIVKMNEAAEEDRQLNTQKKPALKKLTLLPTVVMHLKKQDLKETFIDSGVMSAIKEWLSPLPDRSLPALKIREELLKILQELPSVSQETLKHSGIGRAVMYLYKHPKESRPNKDMAGKLINEWSRPIFGLTSNYKGMTREEREQRDLEQMPQRRRLSSCGGQTPRRDLEKVLTGEEKALRPGDPGFCARARVPMPSNKDYVVRPKWNVEMESSRYQGTSKKGVSRLDKQMRKFTDIRKKSRSAHAVKISIEGNKMPL
ncbi:protein IWS1 homolog isoform X1 [Gopherus flavomarginatus]|uniref:protein IWS1 homolog isoform X1 n=2 Tax=Gopherus flavomarginatus TaxID=286002 RepID=UPI0021CBDAC8|nr:protein IWS1 homolog isoform X1 [Gopherus flavomarginatus]